MKALYSVGNIEIKNKTNKNQKIMKFLTPSSHREGEMVTMNTF